MRILFIAPFGLGLKTTVRVRTLPLARHLAQAGHTVSVLIPPWDCPQDAGKIWQDQGVTLHHVTLSGGLLLVISRMLAVVGRFQPQIVHIVKPRAHAGIVQWLLWYGRKLKPSRRGQTAPRIFLDVDDWEQAWGPIAGYSWPVARFLAWQEEWGLRHTDGITAASHWLQERVREIAPHTPVCYLPNGVTWDAHTRPGSEPVLPQDPPTILLFSRFVEVEPAWMGAFWRHLQSLTPGVQLVVAGQALQPAQEEAFQTALEQETTAANGIAWLGFVSPQTLARLYGQAHCVIFPAASIPLNQAKCSVRLATTLLHGVPVVASAVGEQAHYGADGAAILVPEGASPQDFAQVVAQVLRDPQTHRTQALAASLRLRERYAWSRLGEGLEAWYATLTI